MSPQPKLGVSLVLGLAFLLDSSSVGDQVDFNALAGHLVERARAFDEGSIHYRNYHFVTTDRHYQHLRELIVESQHAQALDPPLRETLRFSLSRDVLKPLNGFEGAIFFNGHRQRLLRRVDEGFGSQNGQIQDMALRQGVRAVIDETRSEDVTYDGQTLVILRNNDRLVYRSRFANPPFHVMHLDMSLAPWQVAIEKGANIADQVIAATQEDDGRYRITYTNRPGSDDMSVGSYEFDPELGFAPTEVAFVSKGRRQFEILYGYEATQDGVLPSPKVTCHANFRSDGLVRVSLWLLDQWSQEVSVEDLEIDLPTRFLVLDERSGAEPAAFFRDLSQEGGARSSQESQSLPRLTRCPELSGEVLRQLFDDWGTGQFRFDLNRDGIVDASDLIVLIENSERSR